MADELHMSASKQLFNCMWRKAEATAVNNLCTAETLAGEKCVHDIRMGVSACVWGVAMTW